MILIGFNRLNAKTRRGSFRPGAKLHMPDMALILSPLSSRYPSLVFPQAEYRTLAHEPFLASVALRPAGARRVIA